jgi:hypothetical protein
MSSLPAAAALRQTARPQTLLFYAVTGTEVVEESDDFTALVDAVREIVDPSTDEDVVIWSGGRAVAAVLCTGQMLWLSGQHFVGNGRGTPPG